MTLRYRATPFPTHLCSHFLVHALLAYGEKRLPNSEPTNFGATVPANWKRDKKTEYSNGRVRGALRLSTSLKYLV